MFKFVVKFGSKGSANRQFDYPYFVAIDYQGNIYVSDCNNHRIQIFNCNGQWMKSIGSKASDSDNYRIVQFDQNMKFVKTFGSEGNENDQLQYPYGIAVDADDNIVVVADAYNHRIQIFSKDGNWKKTIRKQGPDGKFVCPCGVAVCKSSGRIFVSDRDNYRVQVFSSDGKFLFEFGSNGSENAQFINLSGLALSNCGQYLFVCDCYNHHIQLLNAMNGEFVKSYGSDHAQFECPFGICISASGKTIVSECDNN